MIARRRIERERRAQAQPGRVAEAQRVAQSSIELARSILGDAGLARILCKYERMPNTAQTRKRMTDEVLAAVQEKVRGVVTLGAAMPRSGAPKGPPTECRYCLDLAGVETGGQGAWTLAPGGNMILNVAGHIVELNTMDPFHPPFWTFNSSRVVPTLKEPILLFTERDGSPVEAWHGTLTHGVLQERE